MSSGSTQYYQLNQWQETDRILMSEFNQDNQKIDTALSALATKVNGKADTSALSALATKVNGKADTSALNAVTASLNSVAATIPKFASGSYTGDGASSRSITLTFPPKAVLVMSSNGTTTTGDANVYHYGGLALVGLPVYTNKPVSGNAVKVVEIAGNGFTVYYQSLKSDNFRVVAAANQSNQLYHYIALG